MDPFAHTLTGAALAAGGLRKLTPLATAALLIGANAPDIDILVSYGGEYMSLAHRRGWTHGILAWVILPALVTGLLLFWDKWVRRKRLPDAESANMVWLYGVSAIGVLSHPALDWLNNYGIRLLMPFDGQWFYGDALFIVDPWVWLLLGGGCFVSWSRGRASFLCWCFLWAAATWLVFSNPLVPDLARYPWAIGLIFIFSWRLLQPELASTEKSARVALLVAFLYMAGNAVASQVAEAKIAAQMQSLGVENVETVMAGPMPANPFSGTVVIATDTYYLPASWKWLATEPLLFTGRPVNRNIGNPAAMAASAHPHAKRFLTWARFPYCNVEETADGYTVQFADARYAGFRGGISGPTVQLDKKLKLLPASP